MDIRPATELDLRNVAEIDGTIHSPGYLHVERSGEGLSRRWSVEERSLREMRVDRNRLDDELNFLLKSIVLGAEEGMAWVGEHDGVLIALLLAVIDPSAGVLRIADLRVDFDHRGQGIGMGLAYLALSQARERELRAVLAETRTDNLPGARLLEKCGFELSGLDLRRYSNHDLVKETVALRWYAELH